MPFLEYAVFVMMISVLGEVLLHKVEKIAPIVSGEKMEGVCFGKSDVTVKERFAVLNIAVGGDETRKPHPLPRLACGESAAKKLLL